MIESVDRYRVIIMKMMSVGIVRGAEGIWAVLLLISEVVTSVYLQKYEKLKKFQFRVGDIRNSIFRK